MRIYYAHCKSIYDTPQEERDIRTLSILGFEVVNPNNIIHSTGCNDYDPPMGYFTELVGKCHALAFRGLPFGRIPAGVAKEIEAARKMEMPIIELPSLVDRFLGLEETREYLKEVGER